MYIHWIYLGRLILLAIVMHEFLAISVFSPSLKAEEPYPKKVLEVFQWLEMHPAVYVYEERNYKDLAGLPKDSLSTTIKVPHLSGTARYMALAKIAHSRGDFGLRDAYIKEAKADDYPKEIRGIKVTLLEQVKVGIMSRDLWEALLMFEDSSLSTKDLLSHFEMLATRYGRTPGHRRILNVVDKLRRMVREDRSVARDRLRGEPLSEQEQIKNLVFQLRNERCGQMSIQASTSFCGVSPYTSRFDTCKGEASKSAFCQLIKAGSQAVPYLIEALKDDSYTRTINYYMCSKHPASVVEVGECASKILFSIPELEPFHAVFMQFGERTSSSSPSFSAEKGELYHEQWREWWEKNEETLLKGDTS